MAIIVVADKNNTMVDENNIGMSLEIGRVEFLNVELRETYMACYEGRRRKRRESSA